MKVVALPAIIIKQLEQENFHLSSYMGWNAILHKSHAFQKVFTIRLGMMRFCNAYIGVPLTCHVNSFKTRITYSLKEKGLDKGRCGKSTPHRDFLVVQWSLYESSGTYSNPNSVVVGVDRPSKYETAFIGPQQVSQLIIIFRHLLKLPHLNCSPMTKISGQYFS